MSEPRNTVAGRRRAAAVVSMIAAFGLIVTVVLFLLHHGILLIIGLIGVSTAAAGAWWTITERAPRRIVGIVVMAAGIIVLILGLTQLFRHSDDLAWHLLVTVGLLALATVTARLALVADLHTFDASPTKQPRHPVLICNPKSGGGKVERFGLVDAATSMGVEVVLLQPGDDLAQLARAAIARGADCLGMAGGDGSQALVAGIAAEHDLPFVCVTAGTRNHFALDLGLDRNDPRATLAAFTDAVERRVDYATVNGRVFVNNTSLGVYATLVHEDSYREAKAQTAATVLPELLGRTSEPFDLQFTTPDGREIDGSFLILVSNDPYTPTASLDAATRPRLDRGELGVIAVSSATGAEATRLIAMSALGLRRADPSWHEFSTPEYEVRSRSGRIFAGIDGEACELETPLRFVSHPAGLRMLVPATNPTAAARRRSRDVHLRAVVDVAAGRPARI